MHGDEEDLPVLTDLIVAGTRAPQAEREQPAAPPPGGTDADPYGAAGPDPTDAQDLCAALDRLAADGAPGLAGATAADGAPELPAPHPGALAPSGHAEPLPMPEWGASDTAPPAAESAPDAAPAVPAPHPGVHAPDEATAAPGAAVDAEALIADLQAGMDERLEAAVRALRAALHAEVAARVRATLHEPGAPRHD